MNDQRKVSGAAQWARDERLRLTRILGSRCVFCGAVNCLTFDCIRPTGHKHHALGSVARVVFYRQQFRAGNLQLLCSSCNSRKAAHPMQAYLMVPVPPVPQR